MRAVICQHGELRVDDVPSPVPAGGQVVIEVRRCGICGSDLHARKSCDELADLTAELGYDGIMRSEQAVILGHEYVGEIADVGSGATLLRPGTRVVAMPMLRANGAFNPVGLSADAPGGFAEQVLAEQVLTFPVPNGLDTDTAALTEPMAVGLHAVRRSDIRKRDVAVVVGCGPVGLAIICVLRAHGVKAIVASDFSAARRALAQACGADVLVDPAEGSPFAKSPEFGHMVDATGAFDMAHAMIGKLRQLHIPWEQLWRAGDFAGVMSPKRPVIFECVGMPGVIEQLIKTAPLMSRIVVAGVCLQTDRFRPAMASNKQVELRFVVSYTPRDFIDALHLLAEGKVKAAPVLTGVVGLDGVPDAFSTLESGAGRHAKILVDPKSPARSPDLSGEYRHRGGN